MCPLQNTCLGKVDFRSSAYSYWKLPEGTLLSQWAHFHLWKPYSACKALLICLLEELVPNCLSVWPLLIRINKWKAIPLFKEIPIDCWRQIQTNIWNIMRVFHGHDIQKISQKHKKRELIQPEEVLNGLPNHPPSNKCFSLLYFPHIIVLMAARVVIKRLILKPASMASDPSFANYVALRLQASHPFLSAHQCFHPSHP